MNPQTVLLLAKLATDSIPAAIKLIEKWQSAGVVSEMDALNAVNEAKAKYNIAHDKFKERVNATTQGSNSNPEPSVPAAKSSE